MALAHEETVYRNDTDTSNGVSLAAATEGHLIITTVGLSSNSIDPTISGSGWTEFVNVNDGASVRMKSWWKVAGAGEPTTITITFSGSVENFVILSRFSGTHATTPAINDSNGATGTDESVEAGSAGGSGADFVYAAIYYTNGGVAFNDLQDYTELATDVSAASSFWVGWKEDVAAVDPTFGTDGADPWAAYNSGWDAAVGTLLFRRRRN